MTEARIPVVIPSYEPDDRLPDLVETLVKNGFTDIWIVDDGSGEGYREYFEKSRAAGAYLLVHHENMGKGHALKTAMKALLDAVGPELTGCVTADSDGQHSAEDIRKIMDALKEHRESLILGTRSFDGEGIPWKSRMGNTITRFVCRTFAGIPTSDTQTGLRGIPKALMRECLTLPGDRFEFEMQMLLACRGRFEMLDVPIRTIYDSASNHSTHFDTFSDSVKIYKVLFANMFRK